MNEPELRQEGDRPARRHRSDGERRRSAILSEAAKLATVEGIEGLSIGRLADAVGMSKAGLYAHFGSKQELQLATIGAAAERFKGKVIDPALEFPDGAPRLRAMADHYLDQLGDYSGGCFWTATSVEYDDRPGPVRDAIAATMDAWLGELERQARVAGVESSKRFAFELYALVMGTNSRYRLSGDARVFDYAREAVERLLSELPDGTG